MDKSWIRMDRRTDAFQKGFEMFLEFTKKSANRDGKIRCPCMECGNLFFSTIEEVRGHVYFKGFDTNYRKWILHGEELEESEGYRGDCSRVSGISKSNNTESYFTHINTDDEDVVGNNIDMVNDACDKFVDNPGEFKRLLEDAETPLYPGCTNFTKLSSLVKLYNLKSKYGLSDTSFSELLKLLREMLPSDNVLPDSMYNVKKTLTALGMDYEKIHCCRNNCILYRKEYEAQESCPKCGASRWKETDDGTKRVNVPHKVMWYFPPIPRFKRMFQSVDTATNLTWHANERKVAVGKLSHPADSPSWKLVDRMWPNFGKECRNLRLGIAADGINPHKHMSSQYSCWPVLTVTYNLPPWLCMKRKFIMLTVLISGPKQPGNDIDVYLQPLIDDLKQLWDEGVRTWDACKREFFTLRAILLWTINDFPAYSNLSGHTTKGYFACPICSENTCAQSLKNGRKMSYCGHRRFLLSDHHFRKQKKSFNGFQEFRPTPLPVTGEDILRKLDSKSFDSGNKRKKSTADRDCWKKKSIFFELDYWKSLYVRHNLDVMHIEKNVCESIVGTLLNIPGKTKDGLNSRLDLVEMGIRSDLAPVVEERRTYLPPACYTLSKEEKRTFCKCLANLKVPDGYSSNFRNIVSMNDLKLKGMKSHDLHTLMQQLMPVALRSVLPTNVRHVIMRFCFFFNAICKKEIDVSNLDIIQTDLVKTLCLLEKYFPPSFFDIMVHLTVHLVREVRLCGPVFFRWMYPFERYMKVLKGYVRNHYRPEGCIAENYIAEEAIEFCSEYQKGVHAIGNPPGRHEVQCVKDDTGDPLKGGNLLGITRDLWEQVHLYILSNTPEVQPYFKKHMESLKCDIRNKTRKAKWFQNEQNRTFIYWFRDEIQKELSEPDNCVSHTLRWIALGPCFEVMSYSGYDINGIRYHTVERDNKRVTQNSGVSLVAGSMQYSSAKDDNPKFTNLSFYGLVVQIWDVDYIKFRIPVFKCDWADINHGVKTDDCGFTCVNFNKLGHKSDPFILASQATQVFYVEDPCDSQWSVVLSTPHYTHTKSSEGDTFGDIDLIHTPFATQIPNDEIAIDVEDSEEVCVRNDCNGIWIKNKI